jgi:hypothetical protein
MIDLSKCLFTFFYTWAILGAILPPKVFVPGLLPTFFLNLKKKKKKGKEKKKNAYKF